jgi:hypothetical protein
MPAPAAAASPPANDEDTPAVPMPVVPGPVRHAIRPVLPESEIPTAAEFPAIAPTAAAPHTPRDGPPGAAAGSPVTRTQRLRQPDMHTLSEATRRPAPPPVGRPAASRPAPVSDRSTDVAARPRTVLLVAGAVVIVAAMTLILWLSAI